jgi:glutathione S-transferase
LQCALAVIQLILIGQYDSPFVRRVGIALTLYGLPFRHEPWSAFGDADRIAAINPLTRVPLLVLADGNVLNDSHMMLDYLDHLVPAGKALFARREPTRHRQLRIATLATGMADRGVTLFYEKGLHTTPSQRVVDRCTSQIEATLQRLEQERQALKKPWFSGKTYGHADIAVAVVIRFLTEAHPQLMKLRDFPALEAHCAALEAEPVFLAISQRFIPPT